MEYGGRMWQDCIVCHKCRTAEPRRSTNLLFENLSTYYQYAYIQRLTRRRIAKRDGGKQIKTEHFKNIKSIETDKKENDRVQPVRNNSRGGVEIAVTV